MGQECSTCMEGPSILEASQIVKDEDRNQIQKGKV